MIRISIVCVLACLIYVILVLLWGLQHGFDLMDEGFYLVISNDPGQFPTLSGFHYLLSQIPHFTQCRILDFRYSQLVVQVVASFLLSYGYLHFLEKYGVIKSRADFVLGVLFATLGNLLLFAKFPFSISYNALAGLSLFGATGLILEGSVQSMDKNRFQKSAWLVCASGLVYGTTAFSKSPSFLIFLPFAFMLIFISFRSSRLKHAMLFLLTTIASVFGLTLYFGLRALWSPDQEYILHYLLSHNTQHGSLLTTYINSFKDALVHSEPIIWMIPSAIILTLISSSLKKGRRRKFALTSFTIFWLAGGVVLGYSGYLQHDLYKAYVFYVLTATVVSQLCGTAVGIPFKGSTRNLWKPTVIVLIILFLPIACSVGTSNPLLYQSTIYLAALFLVIFTASRVLGNLLGSTLPSLTTTVCCSVIAVGQFYDGFVRHPYALGTRLNAQSENAELKNLRGLKLSHPLNKFLMTTDQILKANDYHPGDCLLVFYNMPGIVNAVGATSQGLGWFNPSPAYAEFNCHYLEKISIKADQHLYMLVGWNLNNAITHGLSKAGFNFPADFDRIGIIKCPVQVGLLDGKPDPDYLQGTNYLYMYRPHKSVVNTSVKN